MKKYGISAIKKQEELKKKFREAGASIEAQNLSEMKRQLAEFKQKLEEFAKKHRNEINKNPVFRKQFLKMCKEIGVDPLASKKGFWAELLGFGDFYYELATQIVNICLATKKRNGGFLEVSECLRYLNKIRSYGSADISEKDIIKAIDSLEKLGKGFEIVHTGNKKLICSVPLELNDDHRLLFQLAEERGYISLSLCKDKLSFSDQRFNRSINLLIKEGIVWIDEQNLAVGDDKATEYLYWFPSLIKSEDKLTDVEFMAIAKSSNKT